MKKSILILVSLFALSACAGEGFNLDKLSACGECVEGLNDLATAQSLQKSMQSVPVSKPGQ